MVRWLFQRKEYGSTPPETSNSIEPSLLPEHVGSMLVGFITMSQSSGIFSFLIRVTFIVASDLSWSPGIELLALLAKAQMYTKTSPAEDVLNPK